MTEIFKDIKDYEGLYQVSNLGNVKSLPKSDGNGNRERILKPEVMKHRTHTNYLRVALSKNGKVTRKQIHRLVAETFIPLVPGKPLVNHLDNCGTNNRVDNLEWCTQKENMAHSAKQGRQELSRYSGGKATGKLKKEKAIKDAKAMLGSVYGKLTLISFYIDSTLAKPRVKFICKCTCGNTVEKVKYNLLKNKQMCIECSLKDRKHNKVKI